jgi:hypothetical protein
MRRGGRNLGKGVVAVVAARWRVAGGGVTAVPGHRRGGVLSAIATQISRPDWVLAYTTGCQPFRLFGRFEDQGAHDDPDMAPQTQKQSVCSMAGPRCDSSTALCQHASGRDTSALCSSSSCTM